MVKPQTFKTLTVSNIHIPRNEANFFEWPTYNDGGISMAADDFTSALFAVWDTTQSWGEPTPDWLLTICELARSLKCGYVLFASDDEVTEGLPVLWNEDESDEDSEDESEIPC